MGTLKVISYNVNRSSERDSNDKVTHFIEKNSDADVYCFQLISKTLLEQVVLTLGERFSSDRAAAFAPYDDEDGFGLALLVGSPLEILSIGEHRLGDEKIYAITAAIQGFGSKPGGLPISLTVCCVHLDNTSERKRLNQLSDLQKSEALTNKEALVIGDFNALCRSDYSSSEWDALVLLAADRGWERRQEEVYKQITTDGDFADAFRRVEVTSASALLDENHTYELKVDGIVYPLRLDYVFVGRNTGLDSMRAQAHHGIQASNHYPISCVLAIKH